MATILEHQRATRLRAMEITVFGAYALFIIAGLLFYGMVDDSPFVALMQAHLELWAAWFTVEGGAVVALLAFLAGGVPIGLALLKHAVSARRRDTLLLVGMPLVLLTCVLIVRAILMLFVPGRLSATGGIAYTLFIAVNALFLVTLIVSPLTLTLAVIRSDIDAQLFRMARLPAIIVTLAMVGMLLATTGWGCIAYAYGPQNFATAGVGALTVGVAWCIVVALMLIATSIAVTATLRQRGRSDIG